MSEGRGSISGRTVWLPGLDGAGAGLGLETAEASEGLQEGPPTQTKKRMGFSPLQLQNDSLQAFPTNNPTSTLGKGWAGCLLPQFTEEETEVQSNQVTCPKSHSKWVRKAEPKPRTQCFLPSL